MLAELKVTHIPRSEEREEYPKGLIRKLLREYQRYRHTHRLSPRAERLSSHPPPADEAPLSGTARMMADLERSLRRQPFMAAQITFMNLSLGESDWRDMRQRHEGKADDRAYRWRERVAEWWGIGDTGRDGRWYPSASEVSKITDATIDAIHADLNMVGPVNEARY